MRQLTMLHYHHHHRRRTIRSLLKYKILLWNNILCIMYIPSHLFPALLLCIIELVVLVEEA